MEPGEATVKVRIVLDPDPVEELKRELDRVNKELSKAWDENAELRARDAVAYMNAVADNKLREAEGRMAQAEQRAVSAERKLAKAIGKLERIKRTAEEPVY